MPALSFAGRIAGGAGKGWQMAGSSSLWARWTVVWSVVAVCLAIVTPTAWAAWAVPLRPGSTASGKASARFPVPPPAPPKVTLLSYAGSCDRTDNRVKLYWPGQPVAPVKWYLHFFLSGKDQRTDVSSVVVPPSGNGLNAWLYQGPIYLEAVSPDGLSTKGPVSTCTNPR